MDTKLTVVLCQTHDRKPLSTVDGLPCGPSDVRPSPLRAPDITLLQIADDAEAQPMGPRTFRRRQREYTVSRGTHE